MKKCLSLIIIHASLIFSAHAQSAGSIDSVYGVNGMVIHPTLVRNQSTLEMDVNNEAMISIELFDLTGRMIKRFVSFKTYEPGHYSESLYFSDLPCGIYFIHFAANDDDTSFRIVRE